MSVLLTQYCSGDKTEKNEMGWACSTYGGEAYTGFWWGNLTERNTWGIVGRIILTFRHHASCILGQAFHYSPENAFYIFNQQIYFII